MTSLRHLPLPALTTRAAAVAVAVGAAVTLSACTSTGTSSTKLTGESKTVQDVVKRFTNLADDGNTPAICRELFTTAFATQVGRGGECSKGLDAAVDAADFTVLDVTSVKFDDPKAARRADATITSTVGPKADDKAKRVITLTRQSTSAKWQIAAISTTATPAAVPSTSPKSAAE